MPKSRTPQVVGFSFQEIPLEEARNAVLAGDGNYSQIKQTLLEKLPQLAPDKAFAFGLPDGKEVPEEHRRGLCMAINATLKRAKLNWRSTYSGTRKLFLCIPRTAAKASNPDGNGYVPRSKYHSMDNTEILKLWKAGKSVPAIISITGENPERIKYVCYQANPRRHKDAPTHPGNGKIPDDQAIKEMETIVVEASKQFKVTPEHIIKGLGRGKAVRKAICVVATRRDIAPRIVAPYVGISKGGVKFNSRQATAFGKKEIAELQEALGR